MDEGAFLLVFSGIRDGSFSIECLRPVPAQWRRRDSLTLENEHPAGDFTRVNGFHKPTKQQPMIFYCRSGVRAQTAVDLAKAAGYKWSVLRRYSVLCSLC